MSSHLQIDVSQFVPGVAVVWLLLRAAAECLERSGEVLLLQRAVAQGEPPLWVERIHPQCQLQMLGSLFIAGTQWAIEVVMSHVFFCFTRSCPTEPRASAADS